MREAQARIEELEGALASVRADNAANSPSSVLSRNPFPAVGGIEASAVPPAGPTDETISPHVGLDESGHVTYHGPTSRFHAFSLTDASPASAEALRGRLYNSHAPAMESNLDMLRHVWQPLLQTKTEDQLGLPPKLANDLLDIYWAWQYPLHNCVYKPCKPWSCYSTRLS